MDVLRTKNSGIRAFSIDIQVLTDYFLNRTQVYSLGRLSLRGKGDVPFGAREALPWEQGRLSLWSREDASFVSKKYHKHGISRV
jgi:hypothetical protein